jgi:hypothetical protein
LARSGDEPALAAARAIDVRLDREEKGGIERLDVLVAAADVPHRGRHAEHDGEKDGEPAEAAPDGAIAMGRRRHGSTS